MVCMLLYLRTSDLIKPLKILFESMFEENYIPSTLKKTAIVPIFKGGDKLSPSNYRPISLLTSSLMKILEHIIRKQDRCGLPRIEGSSQPVSTGIQGEKVTSICAVGRL